MITLLLLSLIASYCLLFQPSHSDLVYPSSVCVIGDVSVAYESSRDPRILMGTYYVVDDDDTDWDDKIVNTSYPVYEHIPFGNDTADKSRYLFKVKTLLSTGGWALSEVLPTQGASITVYLTCFRENLFDCLYNRWFWGFGKYENPIPTLRVQGGECPEAMCIRNLTLTTNGVKSNYAGEFNRTDDENTGRYKWVNTRDTSLTWTYRVSPGAGNTKSYNWVYKENGADRVACAPGSADMPLFCTTFVYVDGSDFSRSRLGLPPVDGGSTEFKIGVCGETKSPTVEPTIEPSMYPSIEPTNRPTSTPRCPKDYIFEAAEEGSKDVTVPCPFGWSGTEIVRDCEIGGIWVTTSDDCFLTSFTDDFSYFRDELWQTNTGYEGSVNVNVFESNSEYKYLKSYPSFKGPLKILFSGNTNTTNCGGYDIQLRDEVYNETDEDLRAYWDCTSAHVMFDELTDTKTAVEPNGAFDGYVIYRQVQGTSALEPTVVFKAHDDGISIAQVTDNDGSFNDAQPLYFGLYDVNGSDVQISFNTLSVTSFIDWFDFLNNDIWTSYPSNGFIGTYTSDIFTNYFKDYDPLPGNFLEFSSPQTLESDDTTFEFASPFTISFAFGIKSLNETFIANSPNNKTSSFVITLTTSPKKSNIFVPDENQYTEQSMSISFDVDNEQVSIGAVSEDVEFMNKTMCDDELFAVLHITTNAELTLYNDDGTECAQIVYTDTDNIYSASSLNWKSFKIEPTANSFVSLSYLDVTAGAVPNIETSAPTSTPTTSPTIQCDYNGQSVGFNETVTDACEFGYFGEGDMGTCSASGEIVNWVEGCFKISFSDNFVASESFQSDQWVVATTEGVSGDAAKALDDSDSLRLIPDDASYVGVVRSRNRIVWPMRVRADVEKRTDECNLWAISLGPEWDVRKDFSTRVNWACLGGGDPPNQFKQMSLYNQSFRLYDAKCWNEEFSNSDTLEVKYTLRDAGIAVGAVVEATGDNCATLKVQIHDILSQSPWQNAYLWFGSYGTTSSTSGDTDLDGKITDPIIGRFQSVSYTQFYSDFDSLMKSRFNVNDSILTWGESDGSPLYMAPNDVYIANDQIFQFEIPFKLKLGIERPNPKTTDPFSAGRFSHFVTFGATEYAEESRDEVVQIVWDGDKKVRLIYGAENIYFAGKAFSSDSEFTEKCNWDQQGSTFDVTIFVDAETITIQDEVCTGNVVGEHGLNMTKISTMSIGFARPERWSDDNAIAFDYIEAYQLPLSYSGNVLPEIGDYRSEIADSIKQIYPDPEEEDLILGLPIWLFVSIVCGLVLCCCCAYCALAWKCRIFPFGGSDESKGKPPQSGSSPILNSSNQHTRVQSASQKQQQPAQQNPSLQHKLLPDTSVSDVNGNGQYNGYNGNNMANVNNMQNMMAQQQSMNNLQAQPMGGVNNGQMTPLQYQMYQQQLFYQQQFMSMMMTDQKQQAILMNMSPLQRKQYISQQMMIYMQRITQMQQQNAIPMQYMQNQFMESNPGGGGEGGEGGGTGGTGAFLEGGMMQTGASMGSTNAMMNMNYGSQMNMMQTNNNQIEMQPMSAQSQPNVDILKEFFNKVPVETFYQMCPVGNDGQARSDLRRARIMIAKFRGINPTDVDEYDEALAYFENLTIHELKGTLADLPMPIYNLLKGDSPNSGIGGNADFLVEFCEKVNLKTIFSQLQSETGLDEPRLNSHYSRIVIANLRSAAFGQVSENDPGARLIVNKTLREMRVYLSNIPMDDLRMLDLKAYHRYANGNGAVSGAGPQKSGGFQFPTINLSYQGDVRQFKPPKFGCFDEIMGFIMNQWPHLQSFKLMHQNSDGSWIRITTNIDIQECIKYAVESKSAYLSLNIIS